MKICPACSTEYPESRTNCERDGVMLVALATGGSERAEDLVGRTVDGRYLVESIIGRGGMGTVYACRHVVVGKLFAMKVLRSGIEQSGEVLQRFIREAQTANSVRSRHIAEMTDFGQLPSGQFYVTMELLEGMDLGKALKRGLSRAELFHVFIQVAEVLELTHQRGIIHRDLKPDNIFLVREDGDPLFVKLLDFGIAKALHAGPSGLTETGVILGTPYYMSPEQARGETLDPRTDIYSLGVIMYRAFTGKLPFIADSAMGVLTRHLTERPELPSQVGGTDPLTERVILCCLEKRPADRFPSMQAVANAMRSIVAAEQAPPIGAPLASAQVLGGTQLMAPQPRPASWQGAGPASYPGAPGAPQGHAIAAPSSAGTASATGQGRAIAAPSSAGVGSATGPHGHAIAAPSSASTPSATGSQARPNSWQGAGPASYGAPAAGPVPFASPASPPGLPGVHNAATPVYASAPGTTGPISRGAAMDVGPMSEQTGRGLSASQAVRGEPPRKKWPLVAGALAMLAAGAVIAVTLGAFSRGTAGAGSGSTATSDSATTMSASASATDVPQVTPGAPASASASATAAPSPSTASADPAPSASASAASTAKSAGARTGGGGAARPPTQPTATATARRPEIRSPFD